MEKWIILIMIVVISLVMLVSIAINDTYISRKNMYKTWECDSLERISHHNDDTILFKFMSVEYEAYKEKCLNK